MYKFIFHKSYNNQILTPVAFSSNVASISIIINLNIMTIKYILILMKKAIKSTLVTTCLILILWGTLYKLTNFATVHTYFWLGVVICVLNTWIDNLRKRKIANVIHVQSFWIVVAGAVLMFHHAGFEAAAVLLAAACFASPFFGATIYEGVVGLSLLITLAWLIP